MHLFPSIYFERIFFFVTFIIKIRRTKFNYMGLYRSSYAQGNSTRFAFNSLSVVIEWVSFFIQLDIEVQLECVLNYIVVEFEF